MHGLASLICNAWLPISHCNKVILISKEQIMRTNFRTQTQEETVADIFNVAAIALTGFLGLLTVAATI